MQLVGAQEIITKSNVTVTWNSKNKPRHSKNAKNNDNGPAIVEEKLHNHGLHLHGPYKNPIDALADVLDTSDHTLMLESKQRHNFECGSVLQDLHFRMHVRFLISPRSLRSRPLTCHSCASRRKKEISEHSELWLFKIKKTGVTCLCWSIAAGASISHA